MNDPATSPLPPGLPTDAQSILALAARSLFDVFAHASEGMLLVDRSGRVVWINDQYRRFLPALGFAREADFVGQPVSAVIENTQMLQVLETGKPILIDLLRMGSEAAVDWPWLSALLSPDRWMLWLGLLFVLSVYYFPTGVVGRLRAQAALRALRSAGGA